MKTILLILFPFYVHSQSLYYTLFKDDNTLHVQAGINTCNFIASSSQLFQYTFCKKVKTGISLGIGLGGTIIVSSFKERIWDGKWHNGDQSVRDELNTDWGGVIGCATFTIGYDIYRKKEQKYLDYN